LYGTAPTEQRSYGKNGFAFAPETHFMYPVRTFTTLLSTIVLTAVLGCASTRTHEGSGEYVDDSVITTKVKAAMLRTPDVNASEVQVETFKGIVQLSGFVSTTGDMQRAIVVASAVNGVKSVSNKMQLK
jgi:hyperosmotically inducible protein